MALSPDGRRVHLTHSTSTGGITVIDPTDDQVIQTIPGPSSNTPVQFSPGGAYGYVRSGGRLVVTSTADDSVTDVPVSGTGPVEFSPAGQYAYVPDRRNSTVDIVWLPTPPTADSTNPDTEAA